LVASLSKRLQPKLNPSFVIASKLNFNFGIRFRAWTSADFVYQKNMYEMVRLASFVLFLIVEVWLLRFQSGCNRN
jgi:hypothetical protein